MSSKQQNPKFSKNISDFCKMINRIQEDYQWNCSEVSRLDKLTQDYLHMLELNGLNYGERAKVATRLAHCRQERRESKDTITILDPIIKFLESGEGKSMMSSMQKILGKTRKIEENMKLRTYRYKVFNTNNG